MVLELIKLLYQEAEMWKILFHGNHRVFSSNIGGYMFKEIYTYLWHCILGLYMGWWYVLCLQGVACYYMMGYVGDTSSLH